MGEVPGCMAVGQAPEVVAQGYGRATPPLAQVERMADRLPWYQHCQPI